MKNIKNLIKPKLALVSVSDKTGIVDFCTTLVKQYGVKIISTGGTYKLLSSTLAIGSEIVEISSYTNSPEIMDGRVKTLHPKIHAGLLCDLDKQSHKDDMQTLDAQKIDIVIVNLYPFYNMVQSGASHDDIIENIDIGGPSMLRSAAKNFKHTAVITNPSDYAKLLENITQNDGGTDEAFRFELCKKAFLHTAYYDSIIASYLCKDDDFFAKKQISIPLELKQELRYGENPQQKANCYSLPLSSGLLSNFTQLGGKELSYNNINDSISALETLFTMPSVAQKSVCIIKHNNPCCFASDVSELLAYKKAISNGDNTSAFGGIVAINGKIDADFAREFTKIFYEVLLCLEITNDAAEILKSKKNLRVLVINKNSSSNSIFTNLRFKISNATALVQTNDDITIASENITLNNPTSEKQISEFIFAISLVRHISSNAICITYNNSLIAIGCGQTSRVDAVKIACQKAQQKCLELGIDISQATLASDAFFPFADNIDVISSYGIKNVIAPSGSIKDEEVLKAATDVKINLAFCKNRFFRH